MNKQEILNRLDKSQFYQELVPSLKINGKPEAQGLCPFHPDHNPSMSVNLETGQYFCHVCNEGGDLFKFYMKFKQVDFKEALSQLSEYSGPAREKVPSKIECVYPYTDESGKVLFEVVRYIPKTFRQRRPDGKGGYVYNLEDVEIVPYNLPKIITSDTVFICEGEKDCDNLANLGLTATTNPMGAGKWREDFGQYLTSKDVVIICDNDESGRKHGNDVAQKSSKYAKTIKVVEQLPGVSAKGDVSDWLNLHPGNNKEKLLEIVKNIPEWSPNEEISNRGVKDLRVVSIYDFLSMEFPVRENILAPWLNTQGLAMVHGIRGLGKTYFVIGIATAVTSGGNFLKWKANKPYGVLHLDGEMPAVTLQERYCQFVVSNDIETTAPLKIVTPDLQEFGMPDLSSHAGQQAVEPHLEGISLVIVDNISTLCKGGRENEAESWLPVQEWALKLRTRGISVLFAHHAGKAGLQRGTSRREDVLDVVISLRRPADYRPGEGARFEVHFEKSRGIYGDDVKPFEAMLITGIDGKQQWVVKDLEESTTEKIVKLLGEGMSQNEIAEELKISKGTVSKHKQKAKNCKLL